MSYTLTEAGKVLTETKDGITLPADYSFETVNDFVHSVDATYELLEALCLGMAAHIEKLERGEFICRKCGMRKDSAREHAHEF